MQALQSLANQLAGHNAAALRAPFPAGDAMQQLNREMTKRFGAVGTGAPPPDKREAAIRHFLRTNSFRVARDLKYVCYGVAEPVGAKKESVLADESAFAALMRHVERTLAKPGLLRRCYEGLLSAYLEFDGFATADESARKNWRRVRDFLETHLNAVASLSPTPKWATCLHKHRNVLTDTPCDRYARQMLVGEKADFGELRESLGLGETSWVTTQTVLTSIRFVCDKQDADFVDRIDHCIKLLREHQTIQNPGLAHLLRRYSRMATPTLHEPLRDFAIAAWGSPLLQKNLRNWDVAGAEATHMVALWLKSRLIKDFFELLSADGVTDRSRVQFWQRYVRSITDMYFALGNHAHYSSNPDFIELRKTMGTSLLRLEGGSPSNNAFLMVMNDYVVMEFGEKGNAAFIFDRRNMPFELRGTVFSGGRSGWPHLERMLHFHPKTDGMTWQLDFEATLRRVVGVEPDDSAEAALRKQRLGRAQVDRIRHECARFGVSLQYKPEQRRYIVRARNENTVLNRALGRLGFTYDPSGFWYIED